MGIFLLSNKDKTNSFELKKQESKTLNGLTITNKGGGHSILEDGRDLPYANIELKTIGKKETIMASSSEQKLWNNYLITFEEVGWDGEYIKFRIKKVGAPKITQNQALDMAEEYCKTELKISQKDINEITMSLTDMGGYYSIGIYSSPDNQKNLDIALEVDKFTGKISKIK
jgi:hypothetical protein